MCVPCVQKDLLKKQRFYVHLKKKPSKDVELKTFFLPFMYFFAIKYKYSLHFFCYFKQNLNKPFVLAISDA